MSELRKNSEEVSRMMTESLLSLEAISLVLGLCYLDNYNCLFQDDDMTFFS